MVKQQRSPPFFLSFPGPFGGPPQPPSSPLSPRSAQRHLPSWARARQPSARAYRAPPAQLRAPAQPTRPAPRPSQRALRGRPAPPPPPARARSAACVLPLRASSSASPACQLPKPLLARLARVCALASCCRHHALRRCAPVGPRTHALHVPRGFALRGSILSCLPRTWAVAQRRRCRGTHLRYISLSPVFSPCFPTMHVPRPPIFSASRRTARKQQSPRPRQLPPPH
jgi:hypothetical protein